MANIAFFGATGLVGSQLLGRLSGHEVTPVGRRNGAGGRAAAVEEWSSVVADLAPDILISALGTTIRAAGSRRAFEAIDHDAVVAIAAAAKAAGARQMLSVSSVGADPASSNFYLRTKGRAEADLIALGFDRLDIFRPGLLVGVRTGQPRLGESLAILLSPLTNALTPRSLDRYRAIAAVDVAAAMARAVGAAAPGTHIHHNRDMLEPQADFA